MRTLSPSSTKQQATTYEMYSSANPEKDLLISQLKAEIFEKEQNEKNYELLYYLYSLDIFSGVVLKGETKMKLLDFIENDFLLVLIFHPKRKGYVFANLLNIKHIQKEITEISIGIQPFETFIEGM